MARRRLWWLLLGLAVLLAWRVGGGEDAEGVQRDRTVDANAADDDSPARGSRPRSQVRLGGRASAADGMVVITGRVIESRSGDPIGGVEVVFRSEAGEETTNAEENGSFRIIVPAGTYRAFVRDDSVLSVGTIERVRVPTLPSADAANTPDEALMPLIVAERDLEGVDLGVVRGGVIIGKVTDRAGRPIPGAAIRATQNNNQRPALGTDVAETDANGKFELRLPEGQIHLEATHPRYAGAANPPTVYVSSDSPSEVEIELIAGCVIAGRVVTADGKPAGEGAIEKRWQSGQFAVDTKIAADGTFRWVTTEVEEITLRAWPWKSPPSEAQAFACAEGARFDNVVFRLSAKGPDLSGLLVDASGAPVPNAYIDLSPLDEGGIAQQERSDADGNWAVFAMPAGNYSVTAFAPGRGFVATVIAIPQHSVRLALGKLGRIEGRTAQLENGSFELELVRCMTANSVELDGDRRLVSVVNGAFVVDNVPTCNLAVRAHWRRNVVEEIVSVESGVGKLELGIGPPRPVHVSGRVLDDQKRPVAAARVFAAHDESNVETTTDDNGRYEIDTFAGASLMAFGDINNTNSARTVVPRSTTDARIEINFELASRPEYIEEDQAEPEEKLHELSETESLDAYIDEEPAAAE